MITWNSLTHGSGPINNSTHPQLAYDKYIHSGREEDLPIESRKEAVSSQVTASCEIYNTMLNAVCEAKQLFKASEWREEKPGF